MEQNKKAGIEYISDIIGRYSEGLANPEEARKARRWLYTNIANPEYDAVFDMLLDRTEYEENEHRTKGAYRRICGRISLEDNLKSSRRTIRGLAYGLASAVVAASVILIVLLGRYDDKGIQLTETYAENMETKEVVLPDGSYMRLNSGTKVIYPSEFGRERTIYVDGEVYLDVVKDSRRPFTVSAAGISVRVHGTRFTVKAYAENRKVDVALMSGSITFESTDPGQEFSMAMEPGDMIRYDRDSGEVENYRIGTQNFDAWYNTGAVRFVNQTLEDIASDLERRFGVRIIIEDSRLAETCYYASFVNNEDIYQILKALNSNNIMRISKRGETIVISSR